MKLRNRPNFGEALIGDLVGWGLGILVVWVYAWVFNPDITSGTVWFVGAMYGSVFNSLTDIKLKVGA